MSDNCHLSKNKDTYQSKKKYIASKLLTLLILLLFFSSMVQAQVYKCENDVGEIKFSDEPCAKGEASSRLNWLNSAASPKKKKQPSAASLRTKKTAKKARKNNAAYVLLSLLTTTQLELETASLRSSYEGEKTDVPELILPDGIIVDLLKVEMISLTSQYGKEGIKMRIVMNDGYEEIKILKKPYPVISGEAKIGRFSKSLQDIKRIEFFNSKKLLKARAKKSSKKPLAAKKPLASKKPVVKKPVVKKPVKKPVKKQSPAANNDVPVIDLDLSPEVKVAKKSSQSKIKSTASGVQVSFVNDKKLALKKNSLSSSKGSLKIRDQYFIVSEENQIPFSAIKRIKVRPTANKSSLLVAIELKTKETKMEVMLPPFTRIQGKSHSGSFDHSLLEIKSISIQQ